MEEAVLIWAFPIHALDLRGTLSFSIASKSRQCLSYRNNDAIPCHCCCCLFRVSEVVRHAGWGEGWDEDSDVFLFPPLTCFPVVPVDGIPPIVACP